MGLNHSSLFSSDDRRITSTDFRGGKVTAVFSDLDLDLRGATVPTSPAILDMRILFAEVDLTVSDGWNVEARVSTPLCEFTDRRMGQTSETDWSTERPNLVLTGFAFISEVNIRD